MLAPTFEVQTYRGISLGWVAIGNRYHARAYAERLDFVGWGWHGWSLACEDWLGLLSLG